MTVAILSFRRPSQVHTIRLYHLDGRPFASTGFLPGDPPGSRWDWITETVAAECECDPDEVGCLESDDGDVVTVDGLPVYFVD